MGYLGNFIVYTLAMVGVIVVALLVFKGTTSGGNFGKKSKYLKLVDSMSLGQRKNLYIVSTGKEQFLIAGDVDKTTLISKLEELDSETACPEIKQSSFKETLNNLPKKDFMDKSNIGIKSSMLSKRPVMVSMLERIKETTNNG